MKLEYHQGAQARKNFETAMGKLYSLEAVSKLTC